MSLRSEWQDAKDVALELFRKGTTKSEMLNVHTEGLPGYPLKFKEDFGPTLDKYEKAKAGPDKTKYANDAKQIALQYKNQINGAAAKLGDAPKHYLLGELQKIVNKIK